MSDVLTATDYEVPDEGQYRVRIEEIKKRSGRNGDFYRFACKVVGGEFDGMWVSFVAGAKLTPAAKLRLAIEDILNRKLQKGESFDIQSLKGKEAVAEVEHQQKDERTFANIAQWFPLREDTTETASQEDDSEDEELDEDEFEDIPF